MPALQESFRCIQIYVQINFLDAESRGSYSVTEIAGNLGLTYVVLCNVDKGVLRSGSLN